MNLSRPSHYAKESALAGVRLVLACTLTLAMMAPGAPGAAQQRPLTAADLPRITPPAPAGAVALSGLNGKALAERLLMEPDAGATLRLAIGMTSPEFQKAANVETLVAALSALRADSMKQLLPALLAPIEAREAKRIAQQAFGDLPTMARSVTTRRHPLGAEGMMAALDAEPLMWPLPASSFATTHLLAAAPAWPSEKQTFTGVNEYEIVGKGMTANVREEITMIFEGQQVGLRQVKRETIEQNGDPAAIGSYVVERGTFEPASGVNTVKASHARRLHATSTHRVTTETVREAKADRCPDAAGLSHGLTVASVTIRATAAATGTGSPSLLESVARGTATGHVNDAAKLAGIDWDVKSETRLETLSAGEDFRLSQSMRLVTNPGGNVPVTITAGQLGVTGVGSTEAARKMLSIQDGFSQDAFGPLLFAYDAAEAEWRAGACVELAVSSGAEPKQLQAGETRRLVVEARHRYDKEPPAVPVTAAPSGGTTAPAEPQRTPAAAMTFTADARGEGGGAVSFNSISRRGIAREVSVSFDPVEGDSLLIRYVYAGFKFVESTAEDCPTMRTNGQEILTARVRLVRSADGSTVYAGTGRFSADIDGCGLTPDRKDPGATGNGSGFGGFKGDNFLGCKVTTVAPEREVQVTMEVLAYDDPQYLKIEWEPVGRAPDVRVTSGCEPAWHAEQVKDLSAEYAREQRTEITDLDALQKIVLRGGLRPGTYQQPDGSPEGRWTLTVTKAARR